MPGMVDCEMMIDAAATIILLDVLIDYTGILNTVRFNCDVLIDYTIMLSNPDVLKDSTIILSTYMCTSGNCSTCKRIGSEYISYKRTYSVSPNH